METISAINERNRNFWEKRSRLVAQLVSNEDILSLAMEDLRSEERRGVPVYNRKTFESAVEDANRVRRPFRQGSRGLNSAEQRLRAQAPRGKVAADGTTIEQVIKSLVLNSSNTDLSAKALWDPFLCKLKDLGLEPKEVPAPGDRKSFGCEYRVKRHVRRMSFKTFSNRISHLRNKKSR